MRTPAALAAVALAVLAPTAHAAQLSLGDTATHEVGMAVFPITLDTPAPAGGVTVDFATFPGTAGDKDFSATQLSVTIPPGEAQASVLVPVGGDDLIEQPETFFGRLTAPVNATIADAEGVATIENTPVKGECKNRLNGTKKNDTLTGTVRGDLISGLTGNDTIDGLTGNDCLDGRGGKDVLRGGDGDDELSGGGDADTLDGGNGSDKINAGSGKNNKVLAGAGNDNVATQNGKKDTVDCGPGSKDKIRADSGDSVKNCEVRVAQH